MEDKKITHLLAVNHLKFQLWAHYAIACVCVQEDLVWTGITNQKHDAR